MQGSQNEHLQIRKAKPRAMYTQCLEHCLICSMCLIILVNKQISEQINEVIFFSEGHTAREEIQYPKPKLHRWSTYIVIIWVSLANFTMVIWKSE